MTSRSLSKANVPDTIDFANAIRADLRVVVVRLIEKGSLHAESDPCIVDITHLPCIVSYMARPKQDSTDTPGARRRRLRHDAKIDVFHYDVGGYIGAALEATAKKARLPFAYRLEYVPPAFNHSLCSVRITPIKPKPRFS